MSLAGLKHFPSPLSRSLSLTVTPAKTDAVIVSRSEILKEIPPLKVAFSGIMHEKDELSSSFLFLFMPHAFPALPPTEQPASLLPNGMYCCICAAHDKCQQLVCVCLNGLPKGLL